MSKPKVLDDYEVPEDYDLSKKFLAALCDKLFDEREALKRALLWVIYEQCVYGGKAYARLLIHGQEAFAALGLKDGCDVSEIDRMLFEGGNDGRTV